LRFSLKLLKNRGGGVNFYLGPPFEIFYWKIFPGGATPYQHPPCETLLIRKMKNSKTILQVIIKIEDKPIIISSLIEIKILQIITEIKIINSRTEIFLRITFIGKTIMSIIALTMHSSLDQKYNALDVNALATNKMIVE
jgi:hypothetical protein